MDHLSVPTDANRPDIEVPYLCQIEYDGKGFCTFPTRQGYKYNNQGWLVWKGSDKDMLAFYQTWLYFGLLQTILHGSFEIQQIIRNGSTGGDKMVIDSTKVALWINDWSDLQRDRTQVLSCLHTAFIHCDYLDQSQMIEARCTEPWAEIVLSIKVLMNSFFSAINSPSKLKPRGPNGDLPCAVLIKRHMVANGWCPLRLRYLFDQFPLHVVYYLASLSQRGRRRKSHNGCMSEGMCVGDSLAPRTPFRCLHTADCNAPCSYASPPMDKVKSILRNRGMPLITCVQDAYGKPHLDVIQANGIVKYVACSHVWADGLGNTEDNSIPQCQLERLIASLRHLQGCAPCLQTRFGKFRLPRVYRRSPLVFWLDTLCIPVDDDQLRAFAIRLMAVTYKGAQSVLVLDSALLEISRSTTTSEEIRARILQSAWMGRCWTLQEARLARTLYIQLADDTFNPRSEEDFVDLEERVRMASLQYHTSQATELRPVGSTWPSQRGIMSQREFQLIEVWNQFLGRSTTKPEDVHAIFANLLGFNAADILSLDDRERMKAMLCAQHYLPLELLFSQSSRLFSGSPLDRWVPRFPRGHRIDEYTKPASARVVPGEGLVLDSSAGTVNFWIPADMWSDDDYSLNFRLIDGYDAEKIWWVSMHRERCESIPDSQSKPKCLLLKHRGLGLKKLGYDSAMARGYLGVGALLCDAKREHDLVRGVFDCAVSFGISSWVASDPALETCDLITGEAIPSRAKVLIEGDIPETYRTLPRRGPDTAIDVLILYNTIILLLILLLPFTVISLEGLRLLFFSTTEFNLYLLLAMALYIDIISLLGVFLLVFYNIAK